MSVHDLIVDELFGQKSLAALIYLVDSGRELGFEFNGQECFISCDNSEKNVSLWVNKQEQSFDSVSELIENAKIKNKQFLNAWNDAEIICLL